MDTERLHKSPNPTAETSEGRPNKSSCLPDRKKIQLPVAPHPRRLVKYTPALPLRKGKRRKDPLPRSSRRVSSAKPEVTGLTPPSRPRTGQTGRSQKPTAKLRTSQKPSAKTGKSQKPGTAPHGGTGKRAPEEGAGTSMDEVGIPKTSTEVRALLLRTPDSDSDSSRSPSPSPKGDPKRHRTGCLSRRFLRQLEWSKVARRDKKLRDNCKRLDELCSEMTVKLDGDSLKKGSSGDVVLLELKGSVEPKLIPDCAGDVCHVLGSSDSEDPSGKERKLSRQSGGGVHSSRTPRRKWPLGQCRKLDYSSGSSCGSPGSDTGGAITHTQTPIPSHVCIPATSTFVPLDLTSAHLNTCPIPCSVAGTGASHTDLGSSTQTHAVPGTSTSSLSKTRALSAPHGTSLVMESHSNLAPPTKSAPPTALAPPLHSAPPTCLTPPTGMSPADVELLHAPGETSVYKGPIQPPMKTAVTAGVCGCEKAADLRERLVDTSSERAAAAPRTCNPAESSFKTTRFHPAKSRRRANPGLSDKAAAASDVKHLTAAESHGSHLGSITGEPESQSQVSAGRKCPPSKRAAAVEAPLRLTKSPGSRRPDSQCVFLQADKIEISPSGSGLSPKQRSEQVNKKCPRQIKSTLLYALPCSKLGRLKRCSKVQTVPSVSRLKCSGCEKRKRNAKPACQNAVRTLSEQASLSEMRDNPSGRFVLDDAMECHAERAHGHRRTLKTKMVSACQCGLSPQSDSPSVGRVSAKTRVSLAGSSRGHEGGPPGVTPTYRRTPKSKRGPPLQDGSAEPPSLSSITPAYGTPTKQNRQAKQSPTPHPKQPPTPHPKQLPTPHPKPPPRRESDTGHCFSEPTRHPEASPVRNLHTAALQHPDTPVHPCPSQLASVSPGLASPSTAGSQAPANLQAYRGSAAAELQVLTSPPALPAVRERRGCLMDGSFSLARAAPNTPMPGDTPRQSSLTPPATNRDSSRVKKTKACHKGPKDPRKTLSGRGDQEVRPKTGSRKSTGSERCPTGDNSTAASSVTSHKGAPQSRDRACRIASNPTDLAAGEGDLTTRGEGSPWPPARAHALRPPSPELIDTPAGVMSSLLGQQSPLSHSQLSDSFRVAGQATVRQENSCPARNPGFLSRLQAKRQRCRELERRLERLTAALQEAREELGREMRQSRRGQREEREEEMGGEGEGAEQGHRPGKH